MIVELVAGRIVAPYLGQSIYTWTSVIGVMLAGISIGNYAGGRIADRACRYSTIATLLSLGAAGCACVPYVNSFVGSWQLLWDWPLPLRILLHIGIVFAVPAVALGMVSPVLAGRAILRRTDTGWIIGKLYGLSIAGSIIGTFATGFGLISWFGVRTIVFAVAATMAIASVTLSIVARYSPNDDDHCTGPVKSQRHRVAVLLRSEFKLLYVVFAASLLTMAVEIIAGRLMAQQYGNSLYSWTIVIGGFLAGMSMGGWCGGWLAMRYGFEQLLAVVFTVAAAAVASIFVADPMLTYIGVLNGLSMPWHIVSRVFALFLIPSIALGTVAPIVAAEALSRSRQQGETIGLVYAVGALGSIVGTFLAGYVLLPAAGARISLVAACLVLWFLAVAQTRYSRIVFRWAALGIIPSSLLAFGINLSTKSIDHTFYHDESQYSAIVVQSEPDAPFKRTMILDTLIHSMVDLEHPLNLLYEYEMVYAAVVNKYFPIEQRLDVFLMGGGGYVFPRYLELTRPNARVEVAEIDFAVTRAAHLAFGLPQDTAIQTVTLDARNRVDEMCRVRDHDADRQRFDLIIGDAFNHLSPPYHLTTLEFMQKLRLLLEKDGIYMFTTIDVPISGKFLAAITSTSRHAFPFVYVFGGRNEGSDRDTFVVVCSMRELDLSELVKSLRTNSEYTFGLVSSTELDALISRTNAKILTDDYAPIDNLLLPVMNSF